MTHLYGLLMLRVRLYRRKTEARPSLSPRPRDGFLPVAASGLSCGRSGRKRGKHRKRRREQNRIHEYAAQVAAAPT